MAEERIILTIDDGYCQEKCYCFPIACSAECEHIDKPTFSYTRQDAIERMAKAIRERACEDYMHKDTDPLTSTASAIDYAESALNALLEAVTNCNQ